MQLKTNNLKNFQTNILQLACVLLITSTVQAQDKDLIIDESDNLEFKQTTLEQVADTTNKTTRYKVDGVVGVVGDNVILDSDIDYMYMQLQTQNISITDVSRCELLDKLLEDKLYEHQAVQDSLVVSDAEINGQIDQQIDYLLSELGSEEKLLEFYRKSSMAEFRKEFFDVTKSNRLATMMSEKIIENVEITPEEVRQYFYKIPEDERPIFGAELEVAQIVIEPEITEEARRETVRQLNEHRRDIVENGTSFATKAVLYSQDPGSNTKGGKITLKKDAPFVKEFKDMAFSLQEGEVSEPFETEFGFHILKVDKVRGQVVDVRHILLIPQVSTETVQKAKEKIETIREKILAGEVTFSEAAQAESDEKETRNNGGQLINPTTGDTKFDLTKMDPALSAQIYNLKDNEISEVFIDEDRTGRKRYKIITVTNRIEEHKADYAQDYEKIRDLALREKQIKAVKEWREKTIKDTYISINKEYTDCDFDNNWLNQ